jgi:hypothetical protein
MSLGACLAPGDDGATDQSTDRLVTNDNMASPISILLGQSESVFHGSTSGATRDGPDAPIGCTGFNVWFAFTLMQREVVYADTAGSNFDTSLYVVDSAGNLVPGMANDDASCLGGNANIEFGGDWREPHGYESAIAGELAPGTYRISVGGCATGTFTLHVQHMPVALGSFFEGRIHADYEGLRLPDNYSLQTHTASTYLAGASRLSSTCGGAASGEDVRWFTSCGNTGDSAVFSLCQGDGATYSRALPQPNGGAPVYFDPVLYTWNGRAGDFGECNDNFFINGLNPPFNCQGTGGDAVNLGSRLRVSLHRGLNGVIVDERSGGSGMTYTLVYRILQ